MCELIRTCTTGCAYVRSFFCTKIQYIRYACEYIQTSIQCELSISFAYINHKFWKSGKLYLNCRAHHWTFVRNEIRNTLFHLISIYLYFHGLMSNCRNIMKYENVPLAIWNPKKNFFERIRIATKILWVLLKLYHFKWIPWANSATKSTNRNWR